MKRRSFVFGSTTSIGWLSALGRLGPAAALAFAQDARAQFRIDVAGVGATQIPLGIGAFGGQDGCPQPIADIVRDDLARSGQFRGVPLGTLTEQGPANDAAWRAQGLEAALGGSVTAAGADRWSVRFRLWDAVRQTDLGGAVYQVGSADLRLAAHRIADFVYQKLTGQRGVFATRIAYVSKSGARNFALIVADSDGENARTALRSREPLLSPTWSPDGGSLAYVSFETGKPVVYTQDIRSGARRAVANFKGSNSAPAYTPDGRSLAVVLSLGGRSQIYRIPSGGGQPQQLTQSGSIATEPVFTPDGAQLVFVSDREGSAQIYVSASDGSGQRRLSYGGGYNVSPAISPDGKTLAYIAQHGDSFELWVQDLAGGNARKLGNGPDDARPSFAPNGQILLYAARGENGGEVLKTVSLDGSVRTTLSGAGAQVREPAWGPWTANP
jgi:TolB protein